MTLHPSHADLSDTQRTALGAITDALAILQAAAPVKLAVEMDTDGLDVADVEVLDATRVAWWSLVCSALAAVAAIRTRDANRRRRCVEAADELASHAIRELRYEAAARRFDLGRA